MAKVLSAAQKAEAGLLGAIPKPLPGDCPRCQAARAARKAAEAEAQEAVEGLKAEVDALAGEVEALRAAMEKEPAEPGNEEEEV